MPMKLKRPCTWRGFPPCAELQDHRTGKCEQHRKETERIIRKERGSTWQRGYDGDWRRVRLQVLKRDHYVCVICQADGRMTPATEVDHIKPFNGVNDPLRLDMSNLQSACIHCHSKKTATEDGAFGNRRTI